MQICIAPMDVASYYSGLKLGFEASGHRVRMYQFDANPYSRYRPDAASSIIERLIYRCTMASWPRHLPGRAARFVIAQVLRIAAFLEAMVTCDGFVFAFGSTFLHGAELPLLRLLGKRVVVVYNGSDSRPAWMSGMCIHGSTALPPSMAVARVRSQIRSVRWAEMFSDARVDHPLSGQLHRRPFINHLIIGHACPQPEYAGKAPAPNGRIHILHAPSRPEYKGSAAIRAVISALIAEGHPITYTELVGRPNREVLDEINQCDLVIDELFSDIPLAGLGTEAAQAGKPALVCGYGSEEIGRFAPAALPITLYASPDRLMDMARRLVVDPGLRSRCGAEAEAFVRTAWDPRLVAARMLALLQRRAPATWVVDPRELRYWQGWGAVDQQVLAYVCQVVSCHSWRGLGIGHNRGLLAQLVRLVARSSGRGAA